MPHSISHRALAADEANFLRKQPRLCADDWLMIASPVFSVGFIAYVVVWLSSWWLPTESFALPIAIAAAPFGAFASVSLYRDLTKDIAIERARRKDDLATGRVQIIEVCDPVVVEQEAGEPTYWIDIGDGKLLLARGDWICDPEIFAGAQWVGEASDILEFPATRFRIHRAESTGIVFRVEYLADPIEPTRMIDEDEVKIPFLSDSELLDGSLDDLVTAVRASPRKLEHLERMQYRDE